MLISRTQNTHQYRSLKHQSLQKPSSESRTLGDRFEATATYAWHTGSLATLAGATTYMIGHNPLATGVAAVVGAGVGATLTYLNREGLF